MIATARKAVASNPPTAMPSRMAIIELGAMIYNARLPCSFSQYNWLDILHNTFIQNAVIAPPTTTKPTYSSGAPMARYTYTYAATASIGRKISKKIHDFSRCCPIIRGYARATIVFRNSLHPITFSEAEKASASFVVIRRLLLFNIFHSLTNQFHKDIFKSWLTFAQPQDLDILLSDDIDDACNRGFLFQDEFQFRAAIHFSQRGFLDLRQIRENLIAKPV